MRVIFRDFFDVSRGDTFRIVPLGDVHIGARACDEKRLRNVVQSIADDPNAYWIGMGDYCDFINPSDPRFSAGSLAKWITVGDFVDLAKAQRERFNDIVAPIANKCLALVEGNHETAITRHYERHIYGEIVSGIKEAAGLDANTKLAMGYGGYLILRFYRSAERKAQTTIKIKLHHGFVGGKLAGAKALNMQRMLVWNDCDIMLMGHSHNTGVQIEAVERVVGKKVMSVPRYGAYTGTFLASYSNDAPATYSEVKGYFPMPVSGVEVLLRPGAKDIRQRIRVVTG